MPICKCCKSASRPLGAIDFNKTCEDRRTPGGRVFPLSPEKVPYYACPNCGFIFTDYCDQWSAGDFKNYIYNDEYQKADADFKIGTAIENTESYAGGKDLASYLEGNQKKIRLLDFGAGGNPGRMGKALIDAGFDVTSYEPYFCDATSVSGFYDVIYCVEVAEHCHDVDAMAKFISTHLSDHGLLYLTTMLHPFPTPNNILDSWYIAPRNGHISIFTLRALTHLFRPYGINIFDSVFGLIGFRKFPNFRTGFFV